MKALVIEAPNKVKIVEMPKPKIDSHQILVKIKNVGICGSDIHVYEGKHPNIIPPIVPGHEFSGIVESIGNNVKRINVGDYVTAMPYVPCYECKYCKNQQYNLCIRIKILGAQVNGAAAEYAVIDEEQVFKLPNNVSFKNGAMIEPLAVALHAYKIANLNKKENILIIGAGTIGLLLTRILKLFGIKKIVVNDIIDYRLSIAKRFGAYITLNSIKENIENKAYELTDGLGFDTIFEAVGLEQTLNNAIKLVCKSGKIIIIGMFPSRSINFNIFDSVRKEIKIQGSFQYNKRDFQEAISILSRKKLDFEEIIKEMPFVNGEEAFEVASKNKNFIKIQLTLD